MTDVVSAARRALKVYSLEPAEWEKRCFTAVNLVSLELLSLRMKHEIVVGNIDVDGRPYYATTQASLQTELDAGYDPILTANAHTWIEMPDGKVLDPTIIPTLALRSILHVKWSDAIYLGPVEGQWRGRTLRYVPMLRGLEYYRHVVISALPEGVAEDFMKRRADAWADGLAALNR
jgi:hypothetical protein